jgi:TBC1 domain family protein 5
VIEADYSVALALLLKYPISGPPHDPRSFVKDATFLRGNLDVSSGSKIVQQYSGRALPTPITSRSSTPLRGGVPSTSSYQRTSNSRSRTPLPSPARFLQQQGGVEALLQGAAKNVLEQGEKLGINQKLRDAVGEVKKNVREFKSPRPTPNPRRTSDVARWSLDEGRYLPPSNTAVVLMEERNQVLARMLDVATEELRLLTLKSDPVTDIKQYQEAIDIAIAKIQFVQVYLQDSSLPLPGEDEATSTHPINIESPKIEEIGAKPSDTRKSAPTISMSPANAGLPEVSRAVPEATNPLDKGLPVTERPKAPVPTRSSLAQSSFAFMLEPDQTAPPPKTSSTFLSSNKKHNAPAREKAAFLFGDVSDADHIGRKNSTVGAEEEFNLGTIKGKESK